MDFKFKKLAWLMPSVVALALAGCGSDNDSTIPVDPTTPSNPAATVPVYEEQAAPTELPDAEVPADTLVLSLIDVKSVLATDSTATTRSVDSSSP